MLTDDERRLLSDFKGTGFRYIGVRFPVPEIISDLTRRGLIACRIVGCVPTYAITDFGRSAVAAES